MRETENVERRHQNLPATGSALAAAARRRVGDPRRARARGSRGFGLVELLVSMSLLTILLALGLPHVDTRRQDVNVSLRRIAADVRWARSRALGTGDHFSFHVTGPNTYQIERLQLAAGTWQVSEVVRSVTLPTAISIVDFTPSTVEFNTRGVAVFPALASPAPWTPRLLDASFGAERSFAIWPSGQFYALP